MIFTEIIELNIFGLNINTKKNISKRSQNEMNDFEYHINNLDNDNDDNTLTSEDSEIKTFTSKISLISEEGIGYYI